MQAIIEGINRFIEDYRAKTIRVDGKVPDNFPKGYLKLHSYTEFLGSFGNLKKTTWIISYVRPSKKPIPVGGFFINYNPSRDDWQQSSKIMLTELIAELITGNKWKDIIYGNEVEPIPDSHN